jgi:hypothetical protein
LWRVNDPLNNENPDVAIISPPAIFKEFNEIPKNANTYFPIKKEMTSIKKTFKEVQAAVLLRLLIVSSFVNPTNTGTVPKGLITEINAAKILIKMSIFF